MKAIKISYWVTTLRICQPSNELDSPYYYTVNSLCCRFEFLCGNQYHGWCGFVVLLALYLGIISRGKKLHEILFFVITDYWFKKGQLLII